MVLLSLSKSSVAVIGHPLAVWSTRFFAHRVVINSPTWAPLWPGGMRCIEGVGPETGRSSAPDQDAPHDVSAADGVEPTQEVLE